MSDAFSRTALLIGADGLARLEASTVAVIGIGGVGSFAVEALARSGLGGLVLVDDDSVCATNINRQVPALHSTVGRPKVEVMLERVLDINPRIRVEALKLRYDADSGEGILRPGLSYVVDAIDTVSSKIDLIVRARRAGIPIISSMGAGNKLDPTRLEVADISATSICPLARVIRKELRKRGIESLKVVYSRETPARLSPPGSVAFVPSAAGLIIAAEVVRDLLAL